MRIGIDARLALYSKRGHGRHIYNLIHNLAKIDSTNEYILYLDRPDEEGCLPTTSNFSKKVIKSWNYLLWEQLLLPIRLWIDKPDLVHFTNHTAPWICPVRNVVTIHDLIFLNSEIPPSPVLYQRFGRFYKALTTPFRARRADRVIACSNFTKGDIVKLLDLPEERIDAILEAVDPQYKLVDDSYLLEMIKQKYGIGKDFILGLGGQDPRKNTSSIIRACKKMKDRYSCKHHLVIAGLENWLKSPVFGLVQDLGLRDSVKFTGFVSDKDLVLLYNAAALFVYPSLSEGFGFPALEAMACGTPVITSNVTALPEVVGDAAILVDPKDIDGLVEAMHDVLSQNSLRLRLIEKGLKRVKHFSWETFAKKTLLVYNRVYRETGGLDKQPERIR